MFGPDPFTSRVEYIVIDFPKHSCLPFAKRRISSKETSKLERSQQYSTLQTSRSIVMEAWSNLTVWLWVVLSVCEDVLMTMPAALPEPLRTLQTPFTVSGSEEAAGGAHCLDEPCQNRFPRNCNLIKATKSFSECSRGPQRRVRDKQYQAAQMVWNQRLQQSSCLNVQEDPVDADARWSPAITEITPESGCGRGSGVSGSENIWGAGLFQAWS